MQMKRFITTFGVIVVMTLIISVTSLCQFKSDYEHQSSVSQSLVKPNASIGNFLGLINPENFSMRHSFAMNYMTDGGGGLSTASYTNSMFYKIADPLNVRFDVTLMGSPFGTYAGYQQNDYNKIFISRAELNYRPWENTYIKVEYNQLPFNRYYYYDRFGPSSFLMGDQ